LFSLALKISGSAKGLQGKSVVIASETTLIYRSTAEVMGSFGHPPLGPGAKDCLNCIVEDKAMIFPIH